MIIRRLRIENFGHFHDFTLELAPGLNRLRRGNEFGKTTLLEFVRRVLWGFPDGRKSAQLNRYPAHFTAGEYGGSLEIELASGERLELARRGQKGELTVRHADGTNEDGAAFLRRLTPVSEECYRHVYAVTLDELEMLSALDSEEIRGRLYGGPITSGDLPLPALGRMLDNRCRELYKQRNGASAVRDAREALREACDAHMRISAQVARRAELKETYADLTAKSAQLQKDADDCAAELAETELLLKAHPQYLKLRELDARLAAAPETAPVSERTALRAEELTRNLEAAERELNAPPPAPERIKELESSIASCDRELAERADTVIPLPSDDDIRTAAELAAEAAELVPPRRFPLRGGLAVLLFFAAAFLWRTFPPAAAAAAAVAAAVAVWSFLGCRRSVAEHRRRVEEHAARTEEMRNRFHLNCPAGLFEAALNLRLRRENLGRELALLRRAAADHARVADLRGELDELCRNCHCADAASVRRMAERSALLAEVRRRRAETEAALNALLPGERRGELENFVPGNAQKRRDAQAERLAGAKNELCLLHRHSGAVANELKHLPEEFAAELAASEVERARAALRETVREYLTVRGARELLAAAIRRYEQESQPEVIKGAEALFSDFTSGRYFRLYKSVATGELLACDRESGLEKNFTALSRGTREELMLAMRLALIDRIERGTEALPVVLDDVGVNFDPGRLNAVERAVERFASGRQVIWLSHS